MTVAVQPPSQSVAPGFTSRLVNGILSIKPIFNLAKYRARQMMIKRAETIGVYWMKEVETLKQHDWQTELAQVQNPNLKYPDYYTVSFHAYDEGNLGWEPALEVEVAAQAVHARIWKDAGAQGDAQLRQSYHDVLKSQITEAPQAILDVACSVGMSTFALQDMYPDAKITGVDLSPYFLAVARYRAAQRQANITWLHAAGEAVPLPDASFDLVSAFLLFHELPQSAAIAVLKEARRLVRPGGHVAIMDMNPHSEIYGKMPPYILTLLKSTEPYLDQYFALDMKQAFVEAGFTEPTITCNSPRHRTLIAKAC